MIQCPEAHLFCTSCMTSYASTLLGEHNPNIVCMDQSGCKLLFPESELRRFLSSSLLELYGRVKQRKEIEAAGLANLEECPFCEYKCVIDNEMEKLFRCENAECAAVTCRTCKKPVSAAHLPFACPLTLCRTIYPKTVKVLCFMHPFGSVVHVGCRSRRGPPSGRSACHRGGHE